MISANPAGHQNLRDGDLPPGVYERMPDGTLVPTKKLLTDDPPRPLSALRQPLHVNARHEIVDVTRQGVDYMKEEAEKHYELRRRVKGADTKVPDAVSLRNLAERAAEQIMGSGA